MCTKPVPFQPFPASVVSKPYICYMRKSGGQERHDSCRRHIRSKLSWVVDDLRGDREDNLIYSASLNSAKARTNTSPPQKKNMSLTLITFAPRTPQSCPHCSPHAAKFRFIRPELRVHEHESPGCNLCKGRARKTKKRHFHCRYQISVYRNPMTGCDER